MLNLSKFNCGCIGTWAVKGKSHLLSSCLEHRRSDDHPSGSFLLRDMNGVKRHRLDEIELGMFLMRLKTPKEDTPSSEVVVRAIKELEDRGEAAFRDMAYTLAQVDPRTFTKISAAAAGKPEGYEVTAKLFLVEGRKIHAIKEIRKATGMSLRDAKIEAERLGDEMGITLLGKPF